MACRVLQRETACRPCRRRLRRGATAIELALVLMLFLTLVLGMLDLGIAVFRYHIVAEAARQGARRAIVHGKLADKLGVWGPESFSVTGEDGHALVTGIQPLLEGLDLSQVTVTAEWPDGGNDPQADNRVRVTVSVPYQPIMIFIFGDYPLTLTGSSTMYIAH